MFILYNNKEYRLNIFSAQQIDSDLVNNPRRYAWIFSFFYESV